MATVLGLTCTTSTPNGARTSSGVKRKSWGLARRPEVEHGHDVAGSHAAQRACRSAHADVDRRREVADQLEGRRKLLKLERHAQDAFDGLLASHSHPQQQRQTEREQLHPDMAKGPDTHVRDQVY
jgi:hypothetical protein